MANEVTILVKAKNDAKAVLADARRDVQGLGREAAGTARQVDKLGEASTTAAKRQAEAAVVTRQVTRSLDDQKDKADALTRRLRLLSLGKYQVELDIDRDGRLNRLLGKTGSLFTGLVERASEAASSVGAKFAEILPGALSSAFSATGPVVQTAVVALAAVIAAALAAAVAAALSGAILAALGSGVIAAGVLGAIKSDRIDQILNGQKVTTRSALNEKGDKTPNYGTDVEQRIGGLIPKVKELFAQFSQPFIEPVARALDLFDKALDRVGPKAEELGQKFAPVVDKLAPALLEMAEQAWPGIVAALDASLPLFDQIAEVLPSIGAAIGSIFQTIVDHKDEAYSGFKLLLDVVGVLIVAIGVLLGVLLDTYGMFMRLSSTIKDSAKWGGNAFGSLLDRISNVANALLYAIGLADRLNGTITGTARRLGSSSDGDGNRAGFGSRATGGIAGGLTRVAERGGELIRLPQGSMVYSAANTNQMLSQGSTGGGQQRLTVELQFTGGDDSGLWSAFQRALRVGEVTVPANAVTS